MRAVLCFGDSNTWGYDAATEGRLQWSERWPGVLQRLMGDGVRIIEEGLNGRSTMFDRPEQPYRDGNASLPMLLETHAPIDDVVVALGINDLFVPGITPRWSARGIESILITIEQSRCGPGGAAPRVLVIAPPPLGTLPEHWAMDAPGATEASRELPAAFRYVCDPRGVPVLDLTGLVEPDPIDGEHFTVQGHAAIAAAVATALG
jgi:lysophospholipase L1-like esterase